MVLAVAVLAGCPNRPPSDDGGGLDGGASGRGYVRWSSVACSAPFDGGVGPADACARPAPHTSVAGLTTPADPDKLRCVGRVQLADRTVVIGFRAGETFDPGAWPGSLELRGEMDVLAASPAMIGQTVTSCEVRLTEGTHTATGRCGNECVVKITDVVLDGGTVTGTIRCGALADDSTPTVYRNVGPGQGVPMMAADFALNGCAPVP
jgi:hypothetical protein